MKKYNFFTFCENLDKIGKDAEEKEKKQKLGEIVSALNDQCKMYCKQSFLTKKNKSTSF